MAMQNQGDLFEAYFRKADLDRDGRISGSEAVAFFQGSNLPKQVLAQIWMFADQNRSGFLGKAEFFNALKLVTVAQSKRDLTPDIVKAALNGPASAKIPAPQINLAGLPVSHPNVAGAAPPAPQLQAVVPNMSQNLGSRGIPTSPVTSMNLQHNQTLGIGFTNPPNSIHGVAGRPVQGVVSQGLPQSPMGSSQENLRGTSGAGGTITARTPPAMLPERGNTPTHPGLPSGAPGHVSSLPTKPPMTSGMMSSGTSAMQPKQPVSRNGLASNFVGDVFSASTPQVQKRSSVPTSAGGLPVSSTLVPVSGSTQSPSNSGPNTFIAQSAAGQHHMVQSHLKHNQQAPVHNIPPSGPRAGSPHTSVGHQPQMQWPRPSQTDLQKYTKVFMEVDTDKDGKITGEEARNLFLSWRLPREVLKQVWDLSDQDNDSMLSLREFCIALYLMERFREGRPLPAVLPSNIVHDFPPTVQQTGGHGNAVRGFLPGLQQPSVSASARPPRPAGKPPLPVPAPSETPPKQQKAKVPVVEKHLVDQLSEEEQKSLNLKFQEASEANKKVEELEKEIKESREKMEFYRVKMQELVLYKSRCDSRYNEVAERAAADKNEVEALAKKYEEKYKQSGAVGSKLTIEESTFRDIQEKKMEVYQAIVKLEHDGSAEDLKVCAGRIQSNTEELMKNLNERCKKYGLRAKPTTLLELPFGWQPGIQESAADWDEGWDKFEDEGFAIVKELSHDIENVIAPPRTRAKLVKKEKNLGAENATIESTSDASKLVKPGATNGPVAENGESGNQKEDVHEVSPAVSPSAKRSHEFVHDERKDGEIGKSDAPSHKGTHSDLGVGDHPPFSVDKNTDEPAWGTFDANDDASSVFSKDMDHDRHANDLFGQGGWDLPPIKTGSSLSGGFLPKLSVFADSVPGTPADSFLPKKSIFADSVPGTPADNFLPNKSIFADSVPGTPADGFLPKKSIFADSVPSTPLNNSSYSPQKGEGPEDRGLNFSRFDSFRSTDSGFNPSERLSRFDSFSSTTDFDSQGGAPFQQKETFSRFDSMRSSSDFDYGHRFSSFDDSDPFGSGPFKSSFGSETPRRDDTFGSSEPFRSSIGSETPRSEVDPYGSVGPFRSSVFSETPKADSDPFGSVGPFRSSFGSETPRADADPFGSVGPFSSSVGSETPRRESDYFAYSGSFKSNYGNENPRSEFNSFGFDGPFGSSLGSETPRHDEPFRSTWGSETPKRGTDDWSAF